MVSNIRDRNIDSSRREDSRKGQVDRCEVVNVRPHVSPYPGDKDFNTVDVQLIDRPRIKGEALHIEFVKLNSLQREHGKFQGHPWNARIGDMIYIYWLAEREALVLGTCTSAEQEPVCRSKADDHQQEYVFKLSPWEEPGKDERGEDYVDFPDPKHPDCFKWWPKTRDSIWIFDCLEGHNCPNCSAEAPCNTLDDHLHSTCFKNFSDISPTAVDKPWRFKFLHHCGSYWYFDDDAVWRICGKLNDSELGFIHHYTNGKIEINSPVEVLIKAPLITLDGDVVITGSLWTAANAYFTGTIDSAGCLDHTPDHNGDAVAEVCRIRHGADGHIDHASLPELARTQKIDPDTGKVVEMRNLSGMVTVLTRAVQQQAEEIAGLKKQLAEVQKAPKRSKTRGTKKCPSVI